MSAIRQAGTRPDQDARPRRLGRELVGRRIDLGRLDLASDPDEARGPREVLRRERIYRRLLAMADSVALAFALVVSVEVAPTRVDAMVLLAVPLVILVSKVRGLYDRDELVIFKSTLDELPRLLGVAAVVTVTLDLLYGAMDGHGRSYGFIFSLLLCLLGTAGMVVTRSLARYLARRISPEERCLIIGDGASCAGLSRRVDELPGVRLVGVVAADDLPNFDRALPELVCRTGTHRLIVAPSSRSSDNRTLDLVRHAKATGARVSIFPTVMAAVGGSVVFDDVSGFTLLGVPRFGLSRSSAAIKRTFDLVGASVCLLFLGPLMLIAAVLIKLDSPGPVRFRQTRVGRDGKPFSMLKFRSMVDGAEAMKKGLMAQNEAEDGLFKIARDPRVTHVGRWLRRARLDELPQLFNVLKGEMSLVGPRPLILEEDERVVGLDRRRLHLTPGVTGPWQVLGPMRVPLGEMAKLDYLYIANWNLWTDIKILLQTALIVGGRKGT
jgi:exopolysaccharide biosynthesis polyprenyl glycosylphosphotransferase